jgi:hypothetical protein
MCCFSGPVRAVSQTSIFARVADDGRQLLAYAMHLEADQEVAMVLPLPVARGSGEDALSFIDLKGYPELFDHLYAVMEFPAAPVFAPAPPESAGIVTRAPLKVQKVGDFEASFVPTVADLARLDERFRLPAGTWDRLPAYRDYGFAVFKLKAGAQAVHPMAFSFPRADASSLFFPTVHIHDGQVHERAGFDHLLYCQIGQERELTVGDWRESPGWVGMKVDPARSHGLVAADQHLYGLELRGQLPNRDTRVSPR